MTDFSRYGWTPPDPDKARAAWRHGLDDGRQARTRLDDAYTDKTLQGAYSHGYGRGMQARLQADYGDPPQ